MRYDYKSLDWGYTGNEEILFIADNGDGSWLGAFSMWLDGVSAYNDNDHHYLALIAEVFAESIEEAEELLDEITDPNIVEEFGWFATHEEGAAAIEEVIGMDWR